MGRPSFPSYYREDGPQCQEYYAALFMTLCINADQFPQGRYECGGVKVFPESRKPVLCVQLSECVRLSLAHQFQDPTFLSFVEPITVEPIAKFQFETEKAVKKPLHRAGTNGTA
jgi:hypothetical protein